MFQLLNLICHFLVSAEKAMAPHSNTLAWKIPWREEPGGLQSMGSQRLRHDWATSLSLFTFMHWRKKWQPTPVFLPEESQGWGSLVGCRLWDRTESAWLKFSEILNEYYNHDPIWVFNTLTKLWFFFFHRIFFSFGFHTSICEVQISNISLNQFLAVCSIFCGILFCPNPDIGEEIELNSSFLFKLTQPI